MLRRLFVVAAITLGLATAPLRAQAAGEDRIIVRIDVGLPVLEAECALLGCTVAESIDGALGTLYLVTAPLTVNVNQLLSNLLALSGVVDAEIDQLAKVSGSSAPNIPAALYDDKPVEYFGTQVIRGYLHQPAAPIVHLRELRNTFSSATGAGIVAVIDTGVDPNHPALKNVLLPGYDFTRNQNGANELLDVTLGNPPQTTGVPPTWVSGNGTGDLSQSTAAVVDQSTAAVVDGNPGYEDFGHGTMVTGLVHLVAPTTHILPLKSFKADGTGYNSDILRAIYYAMTQGANVLNMSFNLSSYSNEMAIAIHLATLQGIVSVAAAGNSGEKTLVYPAALPDVIGVASVSDQEQLSTFSNYGPQLVWIAAPGEGDITTYPFSTWAAAWGTSFSTPLASGMAAVLMSIDAPCNGYSAAQSMSHAKQIGQNAGHGILDLYRAAQSWSAAN